MNAVPTETKIVTRDEGEAALVGELGCFLLRYCRIVRNSAWKPLLFIMCRF